MELVVCATREKYREKPNDAEVVYGDLRGAGREGLDPVMRKSPVVMTNYAVPQFYKRRMKPVGTPKSGDHTELVDVVDKARGY